MATKVLMPQLGESVTEGTITRWLKEVGEEVAKYEALCEVETDKVTAEVPATVSGKLAEIVIEEGTTVAVGELICFIEEEGNNVSKNIVKQNSNGQKARYSPAVMRLAQENNINLTMIKGTGLEGRITRKDVLDYIENKSTSQPVQETNNRNVEVKEQRAENIQKAPVTSSYQLENGDQAIELSQVRKTIAKRMVQSKHEIPHAWLTVEADITDLVKYRDKIKNKFKQEEGFNLTYLPFYIKAVVEAIKEYPMVNSTWSEDKIILKKRINISIAVATDEALYVPVIKDADKKSIFGIAKEIDELARKTKEGKLSLDDLQSGTFTVNNTGTFGSIISAPVINHPQAGIITMEAITKRPVVIDDMIAIRSMVNLCMSFDHRVMDGLIAGNFIQSVKRNFEEMGKREVSVY